jgi:prepilin-type N-terminal cleavage/methylation domain-containing protein
MTRLRATRYGAQGGFTLIELLIAMTITLLIAAAIATAAPAARAAFDLVPAELEMQQRGRVAIDLLSQALRAADAVLPSMPNAAGAFSEVTLIVPVMSAAQGILLLDQPSPAGPMTLDVARCPNLEDVCGFTIGVTAMVSDPVGRDVFKVGSTDPAVRTLTPAAALSQTYPAGATVRRVEQSLFKLDARSSLVRVTAAGAVQPVVDAIADLSFAVAADRIDVSLTVQASTERMRGLIADRVFKTSITRRNPS